MAKLTIVLLLVIFLGWFFSDQLFPDGFQNYIGHLADEIRTAVSF
jgi:hypothetical protein